MRVMALIFKPFETRECEIGTYLALMDNLGNGGFYGNKVKILSINDKYEPRVGAKLWSVSEELIREYF